ncbi:MAG: Threonine--tRNA ligase [Promethearchaeota archaeon]|nr:MAG: Threonine--tRNA ligase [Candidatus Lokiarchaeota archaeon]
MLKIRLPDRSILKIQRGTNVYDVAKSIGLGLARDAVAANINGKKVDLHYKIGEECKLKIFTKQSKEAISILNHSAAHLIATVVKNLYPDVKPAIGPSIDSGGFYYDFYSNKPYFKEDLSLFEEKANEIIKLDLPFNRLELYLDQAEVIYSKNRFKMEILQDIKESIVSLYQIGEDGYLDLCKGPHVPSTGKIGAIKILTSSSVHWKGDQGREKLQRIYGIAFFNNKDLISFLKRREEAERRDHRILGPQLDLFDTAKAYGPGMALFYPKGTILWEIIEEFWRKEHRNAGYDIVRTPHLFRENVWEQSGHLDYYKENMYPVDVGKEKWYVKPMNCPGHMMIYNRKSHSYRELPIRLAEFGTVYRYELSGTLNGLLRVRGFTQDDSHIFMLPDQLEEEILGVIKMVDRFYKIFGFQEWIYHLSTRPDKSIGTKEIWDQSTYALKKALNKAKKNYKIKEGEGAFYGPKIDIDVKDALGRMWQLATIQVDFNLPERFDITYMGDDGNYYRPVVIHRVIFGAVDRFIAILLEHYGGKLPLWLSPVQAIVIPITDRNNEYAKFVEKEIRKDGMRVEVDFSPERMEYKIREAQMNHIPYMIIIGQKEEKNNKISIRSRQGKIRKGVMIQDFVSEVHRKVLEYQ